MCCKLIDDTRAFNINPGLDIMIHHYDGRPFHSAISRAPAHTRASGFGNFRLVTSFFFPFVVTEVIESILSLEIEVKKKGALSK